MGHSGKFNSYERFECADHWCEKDLVLPAPLLSTGRQFHKIYCLVAFSHPAEFGNSRSNSLSMEIITWKMGSGDTGSLMVESTMLFVSTA